MVLRDPCQQLWEPVTWNTASLTFPGDLPPLLQEWVNALCVYMCGHGCMFACICVQACMLHMWMHVCVHGSCVHTHVCTRIAVWVVKTGQLQWLLTMPSLLWQVCPSFCKPRFPPCFDALQARDHLLLWAGVLVAGAEEQSLSWMYGQKSSHSHLIRYSFLFQFFSVFHFGKFLL